MSQQRLLPAVVEQVQHIVDLVGGTRAAHESAHAEHAATLEQLAATREQAQQQARATAVSRQEQALTTHEQVTTQARARLERSMVKLEQEYEARRVEILDESETIRSQAAKKADESKWLAESMYEAALTEPERDLRHAEAEHTDAKHRSKALLERIDTLMPTLGQDDSTFPPGPELPDPGLIDSTLNEAQGILDTETANTSTTMHRWVARFVAFALPSAVGMMLVFTDVLAPAAGWGGGIGGGAVLLAALMMVQHRTRCRHMRTARRMAEHAEALALRRRDVLAGRLKRAEADARVMREEEAAEARGQLASLVERAGPRTQRRLQKLNTIRCDRLAELQAQCTTTIETANATLEATRNEARTDQDAALVQAEQAFEAGTAAQHAAFDQSKRELIEQWRAGLDEMAARHERINAMNTACGPAWGDAWNDVQLPDTFAGDVRVATMSTTIADHTEGFPPADIFPWPGDDHVELPVALNFRDAGSLRIEHDAASRTQALQMLRSIVLRTLTSIPPGRLRLTLCDPVGLGQEFAGFMHLADQDEADILTRIWTEPGHIEARLTDLTEHMENVIQTYLRNEYDSIDEYNDKAGEIAEPYRLLVLADFPEGLSEKAVRRLESIIASGRRCGVFTMIVRDPARDLPEGLSETALNEGTVPLACTNGDWTLTSRSLPRATLRLEAPPDDTQLTRIVESIGHEAAGSRRVEVPFDFVAPKPDSRWTGSTAKELRVPIGQSGATRRLEFRLGRGTTQHALIAGKTGSGKSTLLHVLITNLAMWCSPEEVEFYLVDFKKGVEFQAYAARRLPHARVVAIESDREFGLSVLRKLDAELRRRGECFRNLGVQDIAAFREADDTPMPRVLLVIDEFQEFFVDDDPVAQEASLLLDRLVRQGRAFGMHAILGSQTLDGATLARSTLGQMGVRIALQCSESDSYLILNDDNPAARLLGRPGEAIYNDAGGKIEGNTPFQVVWMEDEQRDELLETVRMLDNDTTREQFVFRGHVPASLPDDSLVKAALAGSAPPLPVGGVLPVRLGEPVAISESTNMFLRPQGGGNAMLVGQHPEAATAVLLGTLAQLALQLPPAHSANEEGLEIWLIDGQSPDAMLAGRVTSFAASLPHPVRRITARNIQTEMEALADRLAERSDGQRQGRSTVLVLGLDLHRLRDIRVQEDDFSFSMDDTPAGPRPDKILADVLREGPTVGMHAVLWFDGTANLTRTLDRASQREFEQKVLFQMSANDSGQLVDSTAASDLGLHRGLLYVEDTGTLEKFRPWALPDAAWLDDVARTLQQRHGG